MQNYALSEKQKTIFKTPTRRTDLSTVIIPLVIMDIWMEIYHRTCFALCKIPYVERKNFIQIRDRAKLPYLNWLQKIYCLYCGYGNGVIRYWAEITGRTEHYWCGIQHEKRARSIALEYQKNFSKYGNEEDFMKKYY